MRAALRGAVAAGVAVALAACSSGGSRTVPTVTAAGGGVNVAGTVASALRLVGVGDSLTAGVQSGGLLGANAANPVAGSLFSAVFATQGNGFWALLWSQANAGANPLNATISPLPLMAGPGLGQILVPNAAGSPTYTSATLCSGTNLAAFSAATASTARINPNTTPFDLGVPGQTLHEALYQTAPETACVYPATLPNGAPNPAPILMAESNAFYPILGTFGGGVTQIQAAAALRPQIATLWLGSNDVLKYALSGGQFPATDQNAFYADMVTAIQTLQASGAKVAVANLVDVIGAAYFTGQTALTQIIVAKLTGSGVPLANAQAIAAFYVGQAQAQGVGPAGYLTLQGLGDVLAAMSASAPTFSPLKNVTWQAGDVVPDAFAATVQTVNDQYNAQIKTAVAATGATLVDVNALFKQIRSGGGYPVGTKCCSLIYGGGFFSLDGIHPSNTGYAVIANLFISTIDTAFSLTIPQVSVATIYATDPFAPH